MNDITNEESFEQTKNDIGFKLGHCSRCNSNNLEIRDSKVICKDCNNWTWLEDAKHSCWNGYVVE